jgi:hypothetical protein
MFKHARPDRVAAGLIMKRKLSLPLAIITGIGLATTASVSRPSQAGEAPGGEYYAPTKDDQPISARSAAQGAEVRTPEEMERADRAVAETTRQQVPPFMPTERDYWAKKAASDAMRETGQDKASALEVEKAEREKLHDSHRRSR